jgi:hypothetical protein
MVYLFFSIKMAMIGTYCAILTAMGVFPGPGYTPMSSQCPMPHDATHPMSGGIGASGASVFGVSEFPATSLSDLKNSVYVKYLLELMPTKYPGNSRLGDVKK